MCLQLLWSRTRVSTPVLASLLILLLRTPHTLRQALHPKRSMFGVNRNEFLGIYTSIHLYRICIQHPLSQGANRDVQMGSLSDRVYCHTAMSP